ncbi:TIGR04222 domain-containing membrane protein [Streptomyces sp. NPDC092295]|uniref:TIGR04222 domain-containing membrane protein n=1 Tax=Streptomyces sp. NPDC092295 TaxID=3366011 RepID=UPI003819E598
MTTILLIAVPLAVAVSSVLLIAGVVRSRGGVTGTPAVHDVWEAAFLGGGPGRVVDAALAGMHADGRLAIGGPGIVAVIRPVAHHPVEQAVLQEHAMAPSGALHALRLAVMRAPAVQQVGDALAARGLVAPRVRTRPWRTWGVTQGVLCFIALPASFIAGAVATFGSSGSGAGGMWAFALLPFLFGGTVTGFVCAAFAGRRITGAGRRALRGFVAGLAYTDASAAHQVAAHGVAGVPDPELREQLRTAARLRPGRDFAPAAHMSAGVVAWCSGADPGSGTGCGGSGSGCGASSCGGGSGGSGGSGGDGGGGGSSCGGGGGGCGGGGGGT